MGVGEPSTTGEVGGAELDEPEGTRMFQGIVLLAMAVGIAGFGVYALADTEEVCRRRARAQGRVVVGAPSGEEMRLVRALGVGSIVVGLVAAVFAVVIIGKLSALEREMHDLDRQQEQHGAPTPL
jgi:hypothetical protein